jgi:adenosylmethionine-8-amino-7-oxononanoate aminotransferase
MKEVCDRHGALLILDEVMSGMGRCGTLHAWQAEGIVPDIQTIGKGIAAGYQNCAAVFVSPHVLQRFMDGSGQFVHGQTYQGMPMHAAAILEVQRIIREENLVTNVGRQGAYLEKELKRLLGNHPNVGNIRGRGLFWGIEFVKNKETKEPLDAKLAIAQRIHNAAISEPFNLCIYPGTGTVDGYTGDHVIISPAYTVRQEDIDYIVGVFSEVVTIVFQELSKL